jgi:sugar lactone lactonase YvrE
MLRSRLLFGVLLAVGACDAGEEALQDQIDALKRENDELARENDLLRGEGEGEGEGEGDVGEGEGEGEGGEGEGEIEFDCASLPAVPLNFTDITPSGGFTSSEDFVFDAEGNYVGVDNDGNLVRINAAGQAQLWFPSCGITAGMAILPNGDVVGCDVGAGAVVRVGVDMSRSVLLGGLAYPNGLDIGPDGFIYVAENAAGRVRRVNPDTGDWTIAAFGLFGPNGVAFTNDASKFYVGSFEGSGVYEINVAVPGEVGTARVFARPGGSALPEPEYPCEGLELGAPCRTLVGFAQGQCGPLANVIDCVEINVCDGAADGSVCNNDPNQRCLDDGTGTVRCQFVGSCYGLAEGASCDAFGDPGTCVDDGFNDAPQCQPIPPCEGKAADDACRTGGVDGVCVDSFGQLNCDTNPCINKAAGGVCEQYGNSGLCVFDGFQFSCNTDPCLVQAVDTGCFINGNPGTCENAGDGSRFCETNPCRFNDDGDACSIGGIAGVCASPFGNSTCDTNPCTESTLGQACADVRGTGTCRYNFIDANVICAATDACVALGEGAACTTFANKSGTCTTLDDADLRCAAPCASPNGDLCAVDGTAGYCGVGGCIPFASSGVSSCGFASSGAACTDAGNTGLCYGDTCVGDVDFLDACENKPVGTSCTVDGYTGACTATPAGLACGIGSPGAPPPCSSEGQFCDDGQGVCDANMVCTEAFASLAAPCIDRPDGAACTFTIQGQTFSDGQCSAEACQSLSWITTPCDGAANGDSCAWLTDTLSPSGLTCLDNQGFVLCVPGQGGEGEGEGETEPPGGIDGLGVDACGNVYASEYTNGRVWRISPSGDVELAADVPSGWIPNIKWGRGVGGFSRNIMYVANRDNSGLFAVEVGVPGATEFYDSGMTPGGP